MKKLPTATHPRNSPALDCWRGELARGERTPTTLDPLWKSACMEATAFEAEAAGCPGLATGYRREALRILRDAARQQRRKSA